MYFDKKYVMILLLCADVNFVPTFFIKGRIDSNGIEVYPPIVKSPAGNGFSEAFTHLRDQQVTKSHLHRVSYKKRRVVW